MAGVPLDWITSNAANNSSSFLTSKYDFRNLVFPSDLGQEHLSHYMVININVPTNNKGEVSGQYDRYFDITTDKSKVNQLQSLEQSFINTARSFLPDARETRRIAQSIALYMPTPLVFNTNNIYEEISLTALGGRLAIGLAAASSGFRNAIRSRIDSGQAASASVLGAAGDVFGKTGVSQIFSAAGMPINPLVEVLFTNVALRQFTFELLMIPRNQKESETIKNIVKTLRFHAAPEISRQFFYINPADFDITFFSKGKENKHLIRINTCVMDRIEVDYTPISGNFSAFENDHPVAVRLSMGLREVEPVHKTRVLQGF